MALSYYTVMLIISYLHLTYSSELTEDQTHMQEQSVSVGECVHTNALLNGSCM